MILRHPGGRRAGRALQASELHEQSLQQEILIRSILVGLVPLPAKIIHRIQPLVVKIREKMAAGKFTKPRFTKPREHAFLSESESVPVPANNFNKPDY